VISAPEARPKELDSPAPGWQLAPVTRRLPRRSDAHAELAAELTPRDFNGDGQIDVAVLIECNGSAQLVAFLSNASGFSKQVLEKPQPYDPREFLHLIRQEYEHDAIGVEYEAIGGHAWCFAKAAGNP
jgi:hypothetical protein